MNNENSPAAESYGQRHARHGERIYGASGTGSAWRILSGSVRLDRETEDTCEFAGIAIAGDVIGAETLIFGHYNFTATALQPCILTRWPGTAESLSGESLLKILANAERRAAEVIALRGGLALERIKRLMALMLSDGEEHRLPSLRDMADITSLRLETVSRVLGTLRAAGMPGAPSLRRRRPPHQNTTAIAS